MEPAVYSHPDYHFLSCGFNMDIRCFLRIRTLKEGVDESYSGAFLLRCCQLCVSHIIPEARLFAHLSHCFSSADVLIEDVYRMVNRRPRCDHGYYALPGCIARLLDCHEVHGIRHRKEK